MECGAARHPVFRILPSGLLERRPDIAAAERTMAQANALIGIAKGAYYPNITLSASVGPESLSITSLPSRFWSLGPALAETILDGGLRKATMQQYRALYDQTTANYRQTVLAAFRDVEDNLAALRVLSQVVARQNEAVESAARALDEAVARYRAGLDPYLNVLSAQVVLLNAREANTNFESQQMVASVQLIKALGGGWDSSKLPAIAGVFSNPEMSLKDEVLGLGVDLLSFFDYLIETGKSLWESGNPAFGFPLSHGGHGRGCGNVEIATAISKGSWAAMGNLVLVFLAVHSPAFPQPFCLSCRSACLRMLPNSFLLAACILIAAPTSLSAPARRSSWSMVRSLLQRSGYSWAFAAVFPTAWRTTCTRGSSCPCCLSSVAELHTAGESSDTD